MYPGNPTSSELSVILNFCAPADAPLAAAAPPESTPF